MRVPSASLPRGAQRDVHVAAEVAALHVGVGDVDVAQHRAQRAEIGDRLGGRAHVRLGDDLEQRHAGAVQVDVGGVARDRGVVDRLAGVLLEMDAHEPHAQRARRAVLLERDVEPAARDDRLLVLRDLIALGQIGIEVVLAREHGVAPDLAVRGEPGADRELDRAAVEHRQHARQREADRVDGVVRRQPVADRRGAEQLRGGAQLRVHFEPDHHLLALLGDHASSGGRARWCRVRR